MVSNAVHQLLMKVYILLWFLVNYIHPFSKVFALIKVASELEPILWGEKYTQDWLPANQREPVRDKVNHSNSHSHPRTIKPNLQNLRMWEEAQWERCYKGRGDSNLEPQNCEANVLNTISDWRIAFHPPQSPYLLSTLFSTERAHCDFITQLHTQNTLLGLLLT